MAAITAYRSILLELPEWDSYLLQESRLPGPRANLELMHAAADLGTLSRFERYLELTPEQAPENTPAVFPLICAVTGLGRLLAEGDLSLVQRLRTFANDPRWRVREAVCMALQRWGAVDMGAVLQEMREWVGGSFLEQRAAAAAMCEPVLLKEYRHAYAVLELLDLITAKIPGRQQRKSEEFRVLRQGLGYCWSVAVAALPMEGKAFFERWLASKDPDVRWILKENLKKNRLTRLDDAWVQNCRTRLEGME